jgi:hypothetical protein
LSLSRRTPTHRKPRKLTKTTLISAGSALAVAGLVAGTTAAWPGSSGAQGNLADAAAFAGSHATASSVAPQTVQADTTHQLRGVQATALQAQLRQAAQARARKAAQARAAARAAAAAKAAAKAKAAQQASSSAATPQGDPQQIAESMLGSFGWSTSQFSCLQPLWQRESGWSVTASNPTSGAYGIPQALPGSKMASAGADWQTSAATQIRWGLGYIQSTYGSPCAAWSHEQAYGWY